MATGAMFDPLVELLRFDFRMLIPDLRGHGKGGELSGPYDVPGLTADLDIVMMESGFERTAVLGTRMAARSPSNWRIPAPRA